MELYDELAFLEADSDEDNPPKTAKQSGKRINKFFYTPSPQRTFKPSIKKATKSSTKTPT